MLNNERNLKVEVEVGISNLFFAKQIEIILSKFGIFESQAIQSFHLYILKHKLLSVKNMNF